MAERSSSRPRRSVSFNAPVQDKEASVSHTLTAERPFPNNQFNRLAMHGDDIQRAMTAVKQAFSTATSTQNPCFSDVISADAANKIIQHFSKSPISFSEGPISLAQLIANVFISSASAPIPNDTLIAPGASILASSFYLIAMPCNSPSGGSHSCPFLTHTPTDAAIAVLQSASISVAAFQRALFGLAQTAETSELLHARFAEMDLDNDGDVGFPEFVIGVSRWVE